MQPRPTPLQPIPPLHACRTFPLLLQIRCPRGRHSLVWCRPCQNRTPQGEARRRSQTTAKPLQRTARRPFSISAHEVEAKIAAVDPLNPQQHCRQSLSFLPNNSNNSK